MSEDAPKRTDINTVGDLRAFLAGVPDETQVWYGYVTWGLMSFLKARATVSVAPGPRPVLVLDPRPPRPMGMERPRPEEKEGG